MMILGSIRGREGGDERWSEGEGGDGEMKGERGKGNKSEREERREEQRNRRWTEGYLCSYEVDKMEEDGFDGAVGCVLRGGEGTSWV